MIRAAIHNFLSNQSIQTRLTAYVVGAIVITSAAVLVAWLPQIEKQKVATNKVELAVNDRTWLSDILNREHRLATALILEDGHTQTGVKIETVEKLLRDAQLAESVSKLESGNGGLILLKFDKVLFNRFGGWYLENDAELTKNLRHLSIQRHSEAGYVKVELTLRGA